MKTKSFAAKAPEKALEYYEFERREPTEYDVEFEVQFCGVCHSDIHTARGDWGETEYPCVTGHEIVGQVTRIGSSVTKFKVGDRVGVGCLVNSCGKCNPCKAGLEQYCDKGATWTYGSNDPIDGTDTKGGYSTIMDATEKFVMNIPDSLNMADAAPLLCAGITMYSPLMHWKTGPGMKVGIIGLGGLGHMGVKYAKAMGAYVGVITSSPEKAETAKQYGADEVIVSSSEADMKGAIRKFDLIIDTIPSAHELKPYLELLNVDGSIVLVGPINPMPGFHGGELIGGRKSIAGSGVGGIKETKEMLEFSAKHGIVPNIEVITMADINKAWDSLVSKQFSKRYVIDIQKSFT
ncbi:MAG TPA: NAD(P)-dependent alcohol dehydrogenase [Candidatus Saccharimonadales bacterium]